MYHWVRSWNGSTSTKFNGCSLQNKAQLRPGQHKPYKFQNKHKKFHTFHNHHFMKIHMHNILDTDDHFQSLTTSRNTVHILVLWQMLQNVWILVICPNIIILFQFRLIAIKLTSPQFSPQPRNIPQTWVDSAISCIIIHIILGFWEFLIKVDAVKWSEDYWQISFMLAPPQVHMFFKAAAVGFCRGVSI